MSIKSPRVLILASEITPLAKVGGLGDVIGALPKALIQENCAPTVAVPFHEIIHQQHFLTAPRLRTTVMVEFCGSQVPVNIWQTTIPHSRVPLLLFDNPLYLSQGDVYINTTTWNPLTKRWCGRATSIIVRYAFFSRAVTSFIQQQPQAFDIVHANDWLTAPVVVELQHWPKSERPKTLFTIHNPGHSLKLTSSLLPLYPVSVQRSLRQDPIRYTSHNPLTRLGITAADKINVVSPGYRGELMTERYGHELAPLLQRRRNQFVGILNGIDTNLFNPKTDPALLRNFSTTNVARNRPFNKRQLQRSCGLKVDSTIPLLGIVSRIESQKGFGLVKQLITQLPKLGAQCLITGVGDHHYEIPLQRLAKQFPHHFVFHNIFDLSLSQQIYGGADIFLMPSLYEPCGLAQLIAMRYGCVPIVRAVGGLKDTVKPGYNGFTFQAYSGQALTRTVRSALSVYRKNSTAWTRLIHNGMTENYSWARSAEAYAQLYRAMLR